MKCLSPNGLFPDPTNEFGYINCTAGSAKRIPCGIGKKWEDETKSCERKGESSVSPGGTISNSFIVSVLRNVCVMI